MNKSVESAKLADGSVNSAKIQDGSIILADLATSVQAKVNMIRHVEGGTETVNLPAANTNYTKWVAFATAYASAPAVVTSPHVGNSSDSVHCGATGITANGFYLNAKKTAGSQTSAEFSWVAVGS